MCGIVGFIGTEEAAPILLDGLARLEYRGYDSAGLAVYDQVEGLKVVKAKGRLQVLSDIVEGGKNIHGTVGLGHTRWATHGEPSDVNSHPQVSMSGRIAVVHNGIIENYVQIKEFLESKDVKFVSQTDTEVVAQLLEYYYRGDIMEALTKVLHRIEGAYALGIICADCPDRLIAARKDSPLILGYGEGCHFMASDVTAVIKYTREVCYLEDGEVTDVRDKKDYVLHICTKYLEPGSMVHGKLGWNRRFLHMQQHSGEHILSGIIHRTHGYDNIGFHMGKDFVTVDFSGLLTEDEIAEAEKWLIQWYLQMNAYLRNIPERKNWRNWNTAAKRSLTGISASSQYPERMYAPAAEHM
mgnify:CR=1 FL=1